MAFNQLFMNINLHSNTKPQLTVDEVEQIQRKKVATIIGHVFQLTYATIFDALIQQEKVNRCNGCAIHHPSQRGHSCLMMDSEDGWFYYQDDLRDKIDLNEVHKTTESVCSALGFKLGIGYLRTYYVFKIKARFLLVASLFWENLSLRLIIRNVNR